LELVGSMHVADQQAVAAVRPTLPAIAAVVDAVAERMRQRGRLIYIGAGTSGRLGILDASECPPTFNVDPNRVVGVIAGGPDAVAASIEGAEDETESGATALSRLDVGPQDSVVGIAASGRTPYVIGALAEAQRRGALSVALVCNLPAPMAAHADHVIAPLVGPEIVTGSTRLKAGTAQKLVLNMLSTAVMVRLGKTYGNLMVDVQQSNAKLRKRAERIVAQACDISAAEARIALDDCRGDIKVAIVTTLADCSPEAARQRLEQAAGSVRQALQQ
jgi:N-acetylmuramic acid 6-phosphate etherase